MYKITTEDLIEREVCKSQLHMFQRMFPNGAVLNRENTRKAKKADFDLCWVADTFLNARNHKRYENAICKKWRGSSDALPSDWFYKYIVKPLKEQKTFFIIR